MTQQELLDEFLSLPLEAQHQVVNFIAFLRQTYTIAQPTSQEVTVDLIGDPFIGMWRDRQDLANSHAWVRSIRENEWSNSRG